MSLTDELETLRERRSNARVWAKAALAEGMNLALTLNPDRFCGTRDEAERFVHEACKVVFRELDRRLHGASRRSSARSTALRFLGVYELHDKRGSLYPHAHLAIRLSPEQQTATELLLHERWSMKFADGENSSGDKRYRFEPPYGSPICKHSGSLPEWELTPIYDHDGWMRYIAKQTTETTKLRLPVEYLARTH